jgi:hypothetical protein
MTEDNFYFIGRAIYKDFPDYFFQLVNLVNKAESRPLNDIDQLPALYYYFYALVGDSADPVKDGRQPALVINQSRLFIGVAV